MITAREVVYSVYGAWRLARLDRGGLQHFNDTVEGFWRSFFAAVILAPFHVVLLRLREAEVIAQVDWLPYALIKAIAYVVGWTIWPLAMFHVCKLIDRETAYIRYIVAYNWAQVIATSLLMVVLLLATGLFSPAGVEAAFIVILLVLLGYQWFIARSALDVSGGIAAGLVFFDLVLSIVIGSVALTMSLHGVPAPAQ